MAQVYSINSRRTRNPFGFSLGINGWLILINLFVFVIYLIFQSHIPIEFVAINPSNILQGKYAWTFLTSMFMHAGFFHLFANMLSLVFIGNLIQRILGQKRYFLFYLISGLFAGAFFILSALVFQADINTFAVGASGALFGLVGLLILLTPNLPVYVMFIPIPIKMKYAGPGILVLLWLISVAGNVPIGNTAHLGGLIAGLVYGFYLKSRYKNKTKMISKRFS